MSCSGLRSELADPRRPVGEGRSGARPMRCAAAGTEQIVTGTAHEERSAPDGVVARVGDVLAGDPDRVAVHGRGAVVAPARAKGVGETLLFVAGEAVVRGCAEATCDIAPLADACERVDRSVRGARIRGVTRIGERDHAATTRSHTDCRIGEVVPSSAEVTGHDELPRARVHDVPGNTGALGPTIWIERCI